MATPTGDVYKAATDRTEAHRVTHQDKTSTTSDKWSLLQRMVKRTRKSGRASSTNKTETPPASQDTVSDYGQRGRLDSDLKLRSLQSNFASQQDVMKELTQELTIAKREVSERDAVVSEYEGRLDQINSDHHIVEERHQKQVDSLREEKEAELSLLQKTVVKQEHAVAELEAALKNKNVQISELHKSLSDKSLKLTQVEEALTEANEKVSKNAEDTSKALEQQKIEHTTALNDIQNKLEERDEAMKRLQTDMDGKDRAMTSLREQLKTVQVVLNDKDLEVSMARETMRQQQHDISSLRDEVVICRTTIEDNRHTMDELTKELNDELVQIKQGLKILKEQLTKKEQDEL